MHFRIKVHKQLYALSFYHVPSDGLVVALEVFRGCKSKITR